MNLKPTSLEIESSFRAAITLIFIASMAISFGLALDSQLNRATYYLVGSLVIAHFLVIYEVVVNRRKALASQQLVKKEILGEDKAEIETDSTKTVSELKKEMLDLLEENEPADPSQLATQIDNFKEEKMDEAIAQLLNSDKVKVTPDSEWLTAETYEEKYGGKE